VPVLDQRPLDRDVRPPAGGTPVSHAGRLVPGALLVAGVAVIATLVGGVVPVVGAPVVAVALGLAVAVVRRPAPALRPGIGFASKRVLQASVVVLGFGLPLGQVAAGGLRSLPVLVGTLVVALVAAWGAARLLGVRGDAGVLVGVGTAICGASAIAAADAVIDADEADVGYAIATIFTFNIVAVLAYPSLGHALGLGQHAFGLWAGTAINDLSSVVAASTVYGHAAAATGVVVKLTRTLAILPICLGLAALRGRRRGAPGAGARLPLRRIVPLFIPAFVLAAGADTLGLVPTGWHHGLSDASTWMITAALAAVGLSVDRRRIRRAGLRPLALGAVLWATVGLTSLGLQALSGSA
jgi:uncharacterized integral membrane protein (TIGR00698 family)